MQYLNKTKVLRMMEVYYIVFQTLIHDKYLKCSVLFFKLKAFFRKLLIINAFLNIMLHTLSAYFPYFLMQFFSFPYFTLKKIFLL